MSHLFAFNNAQDLVAYNVPTGQYDAEQQLWVAEDASRAATSINLTGGLTYSATLNNGIVDVHLDVYSD